MSIENNMKRRSPKLLCEVLKSKNVVCTPNYNVINSYLPFSFFSFFYDNVIAIRCVLCHLSLYLNSKLPPSFLLDNVVKMASKRRSFISLIFIINNNSYNNIKNNNNNGG